MHAVQVGQNPFFSVWYNFAYRPRRVPAHTAFPLQQPRHSKAGRLWGGAFNRHIAVTRADPKAVWRGLAVFRRQ